MTTRIQAVSAMAATATMLIVSAPMQAQAADLGPPPAYKGPIMAPPPPLPPSWTGFYFGINAGYGFGSSDATLAAVSASFGPAFSAGAVPSAASVSSSGFIAGGQLGYNFMLGASWLFGFEADFQYSAIKGETTVNTPAIAPFAASTTIVSHELNWFGTVRARTGFLLSEAFLLYATGGLAVGRVADAASIAFPVLGQLYAGTGSATKWGWTAGGGAEWAFARNWTLKAEYLYYDLGTNTVSIVTVAGGVAGTAAATVPAQGHIGRAGINVRF